VSLDEERAAHNGAQDIWDIPPGRPSTSMERELQLGSSLWHSCKQRFITRTDCSRETSHINYEGLYSYSCAVLCKLAQLHGAIHNSRSDDPLVLHVNTCCYSLRFGNTYRELYVYCHAGVLSNIQSFFEISDSTAGLLQTGMRMHLIKKNPHSWSIFHLELFENKFSSMSCKWTEKHYWFLHIHRLWNWHTCMHVHTSVWHLLFPPQQFSFACHIDSVVVFFTLINLFELIVSVKTNSILPASTGIKRVSSSKVLLIKCTWLIDHQQLWAPLWNNNYLREAIVAAHQSEKHYKAISNLFGVHHCTETKIIHKWKTFKTLVNLPGRPSRFIPKSKTQELQLRLYRPQLAC